MRHGGFGFLFGFRLQGGVEAALAALGLCLVYGVVFTFVFMVMGLMAPNVQAAQGMSMIAFVFAFIFSTYVPWTACRAGSRPSPGTSR